jgi:hypothetical protein
MSTENEICETIEGQRYPIHIRRFEMNPLQTPPWNSWWSCSCEKGQKYGPTLPLQFFETMILNGGKKYCNHLLQILTVYEINRKVVKKRLSTDAHISSYLKTFLSNSESDNLLKIYNENKNRIKDIETKFDNTAYHNNARTIQIDETSKKYTVTLTKTPTSSSTCTCKSFQYRNHCKHITQIQQEEIHKQDIRELGISLALKCSS